MTDFYHRYRGLFETVNEPKYRKAHPLPLVKSVNPNSLHQPIFIPQQGHRKQSHFANLNRSPALDEFQQSVLPKLNKRYPETHKNGLHANLFRNHSQVETQSLKNHVRPQFYQLPKFHSFKPEERRERLMTEGDKPSRPLKQTKVSFREVKNTSKNINQLQREYFKYYPQNEDSIREEVKDYPAGFNRKTRVQTQHQEQSRVIDLKPIIMQRKWQVKILPEKKSPKHFQGEIISPQRNNSKIQTPEKSYRKYQDRQNELYGIKDNQYAFVHSKLEQIKKSERYYPRGFLNSYREALFRRRKFKNNVEQRREKLRSLLYQEDLKYGVI